MTTESEQQERARLLEALIAFYKREKAAGRIKSVKAWATASKCGYNTVNEAIRNKKNKRLDPASYYKLAAGASTLCGRTVTTEELMGLADAPPQTVIESPPHRYQAAIDDLDALPKDAREAFLMLLRTQARNARKRPRRQRASTSAAKA